MATAKKRIGAPRKDDGTRKQQITISVEERKVKLLGGEAKLKKQLTEAVDKAYEAKASK